MPKQEWEKIFKERHDRLSGSDQSGTKVQRTGIIKSHMDLADKWMQPLLRSYAKIFMEDPEADVSGPVLDEKAETITWTVKTANYKPVTVTMDFKPSSHLPGATPEPNRIRVSGLKAELDALAHEEDLGMKISAVKPRVKTKFLSPRKA